MDQDPQLEQLPPAGPLMHVVFLVAAWQLIDSANQSDWLFGSAVWQLIVFGIANAFEIVLNLWPRRFQSAIGELPNDGLALLTLPFASQDEIDAYRLFYYYYESLARLRHGDHNGAIECCQQGLAEFSADASLRSCHAIVLLDQGHCDKAARIFDELRQRSEFPGESTALMLSNIAWADLVSWDPEMLERALDCSRQAIEALPWRAEVKDMRGSVLVVSGEIETGMLLLHEALAENAEPENRELDAAFLALGSARIGRPDEARYWLRQAERLDPRCRQLERIRGEIDR